MANVLRRTFAMWLRGEGVSLWAAANYMVAALRCWCSVGRAIGLQLRHDAECPLPVAGHVAVADEGGIAVCLGRQLIPLKIDFAGTIAIAATLSTTARALPIALPRVSFRAIEDVSPARLPMSRIFLSHSSKDNFKAVALGDWLFENGWADVFLDLDPAQGIHPGERWERALFEHAAEA